MLQLEELFQLLFRRLLQIDFPKVNHDILMQGKHNVSRDVGLVNRQSCQGVRCHCDIVVLDQERGACEDRRSQRNGTQLHISTSSNPWGSAAPVLSLQTFITQTPALVWLKSAALQAGACCLDGRLLSAGPARHGKALDASMGIRWLDNWRVGVSTDPTSRQPKSSDEPRSRESRWSHKSCCGTTSSHLAPRLADAACMHGLKPE